MIKDRFHLKKVVTSVRGYFFLAAILFGIMALCSSAGLPVRADEKHSGVAGEKDMATINEVTSYGMLPIYGRDVVDGEYPVEVVSSSNFFHINEAVLHIEGDKLTAILTMQTKSYELLYAGSAADAAKAPASDYIYPEENDEGFYIWKLEIEALDKAMACAAYSKNRHMWYERQILFDAGSLPEEALLVEVPDYHRIEWAMEVLDKQQAERNQGADPAENTGSVSSGSGRFDVDGQTASDDSEGETGDSLTAEDAENDDRAAFVRTEAMETDLEDGEYSIEVNMTGGSGRASISSPTWYLVKDGHSYARLVWSSTYYDYMIVGGGKYLNETKDGGNSSFTIPIARMDDAIPVIADTTAMGEPVEIEYNLTFYGDTVGEKGMIPQEAATRVLWIALIVIVVGGIVNHLVKTRRKGR